MSIEEIRLIFAFLFSVVTLVILITRYSLSPFVALLLASIVLAITSGIELQLALDQFSDGVGAILRSTALVIGLGAMIGVMLDRSGGAQQIAERLVHVLGSERVGWTLLIVGLLVGIGVWFTVGLVLLVPIAISLARVAKVNLLVPAMSMLAGLSAMHGLTPPHPGPLAAIALLGADIGRTILWSLVVGSISAAIAGPLFWSFFAGRIEMPSYTKPGRLASTLPNEQQADEQTSEKADAKGSQSLVAALAVILLPIGLMLLGSFVQSSRVLVTLGDPQIAMLIGFVLAYFSLGLKCGFSTEAITKLTQESLYPVANVLLVVGAGAGFSRVLIASGVGDALGEVARHVPVPTLVLGWLIAAAFRVSTGSATTAITAAGGLVAAMVTDDMAINRELLVLSLGAGSLTLSHVNDGGFWFVKELFSLTVAETLMTWTVLETVLSLVALVVLLFLNSFV